MKSHPKKSTALADGARVIVLGGGPAGAFFAIHLLTFAKEAGKTIHVTLVDQRMGPALEGGVRELSGCNCCAGVLSPRLQKGLTTLGIRLPESVLCHQFTHIWIHGLWKNFPLKVPRDSHVLSVFRGTLPGKRPGDIRGFDGFLLEKAQKLGAQLIKGQALDLSYTADGRPCVALESPGEERSDLRGDFFAVCTGINSPLFTPFARLHPGFVPPVTRPALIFELTPGRDYLKKYMDRELYILVSTDRLDLDHAALVPKKDCLTVALMGKCIDRASFPGETDAIIKAFFSLEGVGQILPGLTPENSPVVCSCTPLMAISPARMPYGHRMGLAGDAMGAKLYRDGIYSAFTLTRKIARTVMFKGVDEKSLAPAYEKAGQWLKRDNTQSRRLMGIVRRALKSQVLSRILYQTFATEMKFRAIDQWPVGRLLWQIGSGAGDFSSVFRSLVSVPVLASLIRGTLKTLRNIGTELFFGLSWAQIGRYPAVVIKEKRKYIKASISAPLGIPLDEAPEMERMYAVKIRASASTIFRELGRFGESGGKFLRLRFVDVKRITGAANEEGSVVRYTPCFLPISMDLSLIQRLENKALVYEPSPRLTRNGKLIFDISPTRDGNNRLVVYTAFDYRKGQTFFQKIFWRFFKFIFPDFAHDVVWNHAVCCIKGEAEKQEPGLVDKKEGLTL